MLYTMEQRIHTLAKNFVGSAFPAENSFQVQGVKFSTWDAERREVWRNQYWLASAEIESKNFRKAHQIVWKRLRRIVPRIAVVCQCYTEYLGQPFLIRRLGSDMAFIRWTGERPGTGMMFREDQQKALDLLLADRQIPDEFVWYWNDATNSTGYASKLLLMFSGVEALVKIKAGKNAGKKDFSMLERILGRKLKNVLWGKPPKTSIALRNRLVHGEYFARRDAKQDYLELLHHKVISYLNKVSFHQKLLDEDIVSPQRHPIGSRDHSALFLRARGNAKLSLLDVLADLENNFDQPEHYEYVWDKTIQGNF